jgi:hypothetical protein
MMGCCYWHGHGPWCYRGGYVDEWDERPEYRRRRARGRRLDEEELAAHLEDLEDEISQLRQLLEEVRGTGRGADS